MTDATLILEQASAGDAQAAQELFPLVYNELRRIAAARLASETPGQTLQPTALVHEAFVRLVGENAPARYTCRSHFFAVAAEAMSRILVDRARAKLAEKRGGDRKRLDLDAEQLPSTDCRAEQTVAISDALEVLAKLDPLATELLKLRYFGGFTLDEAAQTLEISRTTAYEHWRFAKAWLQEQVQP
jgi:RNA polymerase sigma factor (TIGR02999 family)